MPSRSRSRSLSGSSPGGADERRSPEQGSGTPRRTISPRDRVNGDARSNSPSQRPSKSRTRSRSPDRSARGPSQGRSPRRRSPQPRSSKIIVEKLTKNVNEAHLREIFGSYGPVREVDLPMNRQFNTNRGTAYILYEEIEAAESAIAHMHEAQFDGAVINVSIVLPRRKFSQSPPPSQRVTAHQERLRAPPPYRGQPPPGPGRYRSPPGPPRRASPSNRRYPPSDRGRDFDTYRPRSYSRSRSPRRSRSRSFSSRSPSRSPPPRRGQDYRRRDSPPRRNEGQRGGTTRRRSPSYSSYDSYSDRERSRSRDRRRDRR